MVARAAVLIIMPLNYSWDWWPLKLDAGRGNWVSSRRQMKWNETANYAETAALKRAARIRNVLVEKGRWEKIAAVAPPHPPPSLTTLGIPLILNTFHIVKTLKIPAWPRGGDVHTQLLAAGNLLTSQCPAQVEDVCVCLASHTHTDLFKECIYISKVTRYIIGGMVPQKSSKEKKKTHSQQTALAFYSPKAQRV